MLRLIGFIVILLLAFGISAQPDPNNSSKPFILPMADPPGPDTWLFGQAYGNTTGAFNFGAAWYSAGQGLHFGLDFPMPCGTELVAVADGEVTFVDNLSRGAGPHNLIIRHPQHELTSLYGHLLEPSPLVPGQQVRQGDFVGYSGDPDITCDSRPHLHFEVRSIGEFTAYNPIDYINANWHSLATVGGYGYPLFQQDLYNSRRWLSLDDQPAVNFGGARLNSYGLTWPLPREIQPAPNAPLADEFTPLPDDATWSLRQLGTNQCCWEQWWHPTDSDTLYVIDGEAGQQASVVAWSADEGVPREVVNPAPPAITSPDGSYQIFNNGQITIINMQNPDESYVVNTEGVTPTINTDNSKLTWTVRSRAALPGEQQPRSTVWVSNLDGSEPYEAISVPGASGRWLDADRLLITVPSEGRLTSLGVYDTRDQTTILLGTWRNMRNLSVAPGGERVMFYISWQAEEDTNESGVYVVETRQDAEPQLLSWFGGWRWRDAESVYYLPYQPENPYHTLNYYHIPTGETRTLAGPTPEAENEMYFTIMNGEWEVSADGRRIVFQNAIDRNMWLLEMPLTEVIQQ